MPLLMKQLSGDSMGLSTTRISRAPAERSVESYMEVIRSFLRPQKVAFSTYCDLSNLPVFCISCGFIMR
jgi:hypothetical protein